MKGMLQVKTQFCQVKFYDAKGKLLGERHVPRGAAASSPVPPRPPKGWRFDHWEPQVSFVLSDLCVRAVYAPKEYAVTFISETGAVLKREYVPHGKDATPPLYVSINRGRPAAWSGRTTNIQRPQAFYAVFERPLA